MKEKTTFSLWMRVLLFLVLLVPLVHGYGQNRVFATRLLEDSNVSNPNYTVDGNLLTYGRMKAAGFTESFVGKLTVGFEEPIPADHAVYIKIKADDNQLLNPLLGGTLGGLLDGLLGGLLGSHSFSIDTYNDNTLVFSESTSSISESTKLRIVQDKAGDFLIAIRVSEQFNKLTITNFNRGLLPLLKAELDVYGAFYEGATGTSCGRPIATSFDSKGIDISLLKGLTNNTYYHAIDANPETYSTLKVGGLLNVNLGGSLSQFFYFPTVSNENTTFNITLGSQGGLIDANVINSLEVRAYKGNEEVYVRSLQGGLLHGTNLIDLLRNREKGVLTFAPGKPFDKVEVRVNNTVDIGVLKGGVLIYDVERFDGATCVNPKISTPTPTAVPFETASCATFLVGFQNVDFPANVLDNNNETFATLYADAGALLSSFASKGMIHMAYNEVVPAYTTSYIRIDTEGELLGNLVGGTLGNLLGGVVGALIGNHYFEVDAYEGTTEVLHATSQNGIKTSRGGKMTLVQDTIGRYYIAVTPNVPYQSIKITNKVSSIPNGAIRTLKVYNMCREIGTDACFAPQFTSFNQIGLTLGAGDLGKPGVKNPQYAISGNSSEYAELNNGLVAVGGHLSQIVYFNKPSQPGDQVKVRLQLTNPSVLSVDLLGRCKVVTYLGDEQKESFTLEQGLITNLNVLNLFKSGGIQTLVFDTTQRFDRVELQVGSLLNVAAAATVRLYEVKRLSATCPVTSTPSPFTAPICATKVLAASNANDLNHLVDEDFDSFATLQSGAGVLLGLGQLEGFVELGYPTEVPANTTSYVRIDFEDTVLKQLLGGSLGNLLTSVVDGLLLGNHYFKVTVKDKNGTILLEEGSQMLNSTHRAGKIRVVVDKLGRTYLAITPTKAYQSVRITDVSKALVGGGGINAMNVYGMCYETATDACVAPFVTSYEYEGLNLSVNDLNRTGVTNPERAIDDNSTYASKLSLGTLNVAGQVKQWFYFNSLSEENDVTNIRLKVGAGGITLPILSKLDIAAYKGDTFVDRLDWNNGLLEGTDVLNLLNSADIVDIPFKPNGQYDRISIGLKSLISAEVLSSIEIYKVERLCKPLGSNQNLVSWKSYKVNDDATVTSVSGGEQIEYTIHVKNVGETTISQFSIVDHLPTGTTISSADASEGVVSADGTQVLFEFSGTLTPGSERQFVFYVDVQSDLTGILEIKNVAFTKEEGSDLSYPSYPPVDNTNPTEADLTKNPGTIIQVSHTITLPKAIITSDKAQDLCAEETFVLDSNIAETEADTYQWYFDGEAIDATIAGSTNPNYGKEKTLETNHPGSYTVIYTKGTEVAELADAFVVTQLPSPVIQFSGNQRINTKVGDLVNLPTASFSEGSGTIEWYDQNGDVLGDYRLTFDTPGIYTFTVVATNNTCSSVESVIVTVLDNSNCPPAIERVYARDRTSWGSIITGGVTNSDYAVDGNPTTHSRIVTGLGVAGIGTAWQNIYFDHEVEAGTPVTIKLGKEYSGLVLAGGLSVQGLDANGKTIGGLKPVQGGLLDLLSADNVGEFTFVPSTSSGPKKYKGVRISQGSLVGVAQIAKVYSVFYTKLGNVQCDPVVTTIDGSKSAHVNILDVYHGVGDIGLGVASSLSGVYNPWRAVDNDPESFATISRVLGVANQAHMTVVFKQQAMPTDELHIITEIPGNPVLSLELIKGYKVQRYLGDTKVGPEIEGSRTNILDLKLLGINYRNKYKFVVQAYDEPYDRVKITYTTLVSVIGDFVNIYDVNIVPKVDPGYQGGQDYLEMCFGGILELKPIDGCTAYKVFKTADNEEEITRLSSFQFKLPNDLYTVELNRSEDETPNMVTYHVVYVQAYRNGCEAGASVPVYLEMKNCSVKSNLNVTQKIK